MNDFKHYGSSGKKKKTPKKNNPPLLTPFESEAFVFQKLLD